MKRFFALWCLFFTSVLMIPMKIPSQANMDTNTDDDYDLYVNVIEHYQNMMDVVISSESEDLLINLIHMPKLSLHRALKIQGNALGIHDLSCTYKFYL